MSSMITFELDHSFAGDLASQVLSVPIHDDYLIDVTVNKYSFCDQLLG